MAQALASVLVSAILMSGGAPSAGERTQDVGACLQGELSHVVAKSGAVMLQKRKGLIAKQVSDKGPSSNAIVDFLFGHTYGKRRCECLGIDDVEGNVTATLKNGTRFAYPADLGARCKAWDMETHPECPGKSWCEQDWCFVDPCSCELDVPPQEATFLPGTTYHGKPMYFSYDTCGSPDRDSANATNTSVEQAACKVSVDPAKNGDAKCRCVGFDGQTGTRKMQINGSMVSFPPSAGSTCSAWDKDNHPECVGTSNPPSWCFLSWCFVDPCSCKLEVPPETSSYLASADVGGNPVYFSYATCGELETTHEENASNHSEQACVNQATMDDCLRLSTCAWTGQACLNQALVYVCWRDLLKPPKSATVRVGSLIALILPSFGWLHGAI